MRNTLASLLAVSITIAQPAPTICQSQNDQGRVRITTGEVLLDMVVRDKQGRLVKNLAASDVEVYEDGVRQKLESFRLITREPEGKAGEPAKGKAASGDQAGQPIVPESGFITVAMVFDNIKPDFRPFACQAAKAYANENIKSKDYVGVFALGMSLAPVQSFTRDMELTRKAIEQVESMAYNTNIKPGTGQDLINKAERMPDANDPSEKLWAMFNGKMVEAYEKLELQRKGQATVNGLMAIIEAQKEMTGRKAILFFSDEVAITPEIAQQFADVTSAANKANVTIYTVDAAGLRAESQTSEAARNQQTLAERARRRADTGGPILGQAVLKDMEKNESIVNNSARGRLEQLALWTGGFIVSDTNDMAKRLGRVDEELRTYYLASYITTNQNQDGKFRQIEVKLKRPGLIVQSRKGYIAAAPVASFADFETAALAALNNSPAALPVKAMALSFPQASPVARVPVMAQIPSDMITFVEDKTAKTWTMDFRVIALIKDRDKQMVKNLSQQFRLGGPLNKLDEAKRNGLSYYREAELPTGAYEIEIIAHDAAGAKASMQRISLEVLAEGESKVSLSSPVIVASAAQAPANRQADNLFVAGDLLLMPNFGVPIRKSTSKQLPFFFTVRPAKGGAAPTAQLEILQNGKSLGQLPLPLPAADASGRIQFVSALPLESLSAGSYELKISVSDAKSAVSRSVAFAVEP
ncbi:MAG TPA: VWA domain-containing protein [Blastocatellia bacterium]|nr:VWA domain-containing protein [Blastocatellia bacterium]